MKKQIENRYKKTLENIKSTLEKNKSFNVDLKNSSIDHFIIDNDLYHNILIDKYQDKLKISDIENIDHLLNNPIDDHILFDLERLRILDIKENLIRSYIENKDYLINECNKIKNDPKYGFYDEDIDQYWFIVFNINNYELTITDDQNVGRIGSSDELLIYDLF